MLTACSRRLAKKALSPSKLKRQTKGYATQTKPKVEDVDLQTVPFVFPFPSFNPVEVHKFSPEELKEVEARLAKINADPKQRAALRARVEIGKDHQKTALKFWNIMHPLYGYPIPQQPGLKRDVFAGVAYCTPTSTGGWGEFAYAIKFYQSKLQQDPDFYKLHADLSNPDIEVAKKALAVINKLIDSIPTNSPNAKTALGHLITKGHYKEIKTGEALKFANGFINDLKRELRVEITTPHKLSETEVQHYTNTFKQLSGDDRTKVILTAKEDPSIMGGVILNVGGTVYDNSWKSQHEKALEMLSGSDKL